MKITKKILALSATLVCVGLLSSCGAMGKIAGILNDNPVVNKVDQYLPHQHDFENYVSNNDATCISDGTMTAKCEGCNETRTIPERHTAGHIIVTDEVVAESCTEPGYTKGSHCSRCNEVISGREEIPPMGHDYDDYYKCAVCEYEKQLLIYEKKTYGEEEGYEVVGICELEAEYIIIPETYSDLPVKSISSDAFSGGINVKSILIPASVESVGEGALRFCHSLETIEVTEGNFVYKSQDNCLISKASATLVAGCKYSSIPADVTAIAPYAFANCLGLTSLNLSASVTSVSPRAFEGCANLESITVDSLNSVYKSEGNCIIEKASGKLVLGCKNSMIPDSVTVIGSYAFSECTALLSLTIPQPVTLIEDFAFEGCKKLVEVKNLSSVAISAGSRENGGVALYALNVYDALGESKIKTDSNGFVFFADGENILLLGYVGEESFVILPLGYENKNYKLAPYAFAYNTEITEVMVSEGVTEIGAWSFAYCTSLERVAVMKDVSKIYEGAFAGCANLEILSVVKTNEHYRVDNNLLIEIATKTLIFAKNNLIPDDGSVEHIGDYAFYGCTEFDTISIPETIISIGKSAFAYSGFEKIIIAKGTESIGDYAFAHCNALTEITIPKSTESIGAYVFYSGLSLSDINYRGRKSEWENVLKGENWEPTATGCKIHCTNGDIGFSGAENR